MIIKKTKYTMAHTDRDNIKLEKNCRKPGIYNQN